MQQWAFSPLPRALEEVQSVNPSSCNSATYLAKPTTFPIPVRPSYIKTVTQPWHLLITGQSFRGLQNRNLWDFSINNEETVTQGQADVQLQEGSPEKWKQHETL